MARGETRAIFLSPSYLSVGRESAKTRRIIITWVRFVNFRSLS